MTGRPIPIKHPDDPIILMGKKPHQLLSAKWVSHLWHPAVNIREGIKHYVLELAIPGISKKDVSIELEDGIITIQGEARSQEGYEWNLHRKEYQVASFIRKFNLPVDSQLSMIRASLDRGILKIYVPKSNVITDSTSKTITVD